MRKFDFKLALNLLYGQFHKIFLLIIFISLAAAGRYAVTSFMNNINYSIKDEAQTLLMADIEISKRTAFTDTEILNIINLVQKKISIQKFTNFITMTFSEKNFKNRLVELKAVDHGFPFYGNIKIKNENGVQLSATEKEFHQKYQTYISPELAVHLNITINDKIKIGDINFTVKGIVEKHPGINNGFFTLGPVIYISNKHINKLGLIDKGSRINYSLLIKTQDMNTTEKLYQNLNTFYGININNAEQDNRNSARVRIKTYKDSFGRSQHFFERLEDYLNILTLFIFILCGLNIGFLTNSFLKDNLDQLAVLRVLGGNKLRLILIYAFIFFIIIICGTITGIIAGSFIQFGLKYILSEYIPSNLNFINNFNIKIISEVFFMVILFTLIFCLSKFLAVFEIKPQIIFRHESGIDLKYKHSYFINFISFIIILIISVRDTNSWVKGPSIICSALIAIFILTIIWKFFLKILYKLFYKSNDFSIRSCLNNLSGKFYNSTAAAVTLSTGVMLLCLLSMYQQGLNRELDSDSENSRLPDYFLIDIQDDQIENLKIFLNKNNVNDFRFFPMVKARYRKINHSDIKFSETNTRDSEDSNRMRNREQNLSFRYNLGSSEKIVKGTWLDTQDKFKSEVSLEERFAERIGAKLDDILTFSVQGKEISVKVTSLRKVNWASFEPNFFILMSPHLLEKAPKIWVGILKTVNDSDIISKIVKEFPNITVVDVAETAGKILHIINAVSSAVRYIAYISIIAGILILIGILITTIEHRKSDIAIFKVCGISHIKIIKSVYYEFFYIGAFSTIIGALLAYIFAIIILHYILNFPYYFSVKYLSIILFSVLSLTLLIGYGLTKILLKTRPVDMLRSE